jgi:hypothetical protein
MVDSELVAVDAEAQAGSTDLAVLPNPGGEGEQAKPEYRRQGPMRHDCHDGVRGDPTDRIRELIAVEDHRAEDVRRHRLHDRRPRFAGPGARSLEMRGREMKGRLRVDAESLSTTRAHEPWALPSIALARALPPKEKK